MPQSKARALRANGQPACLPCRRRKSRCTFELGLQACLMCRAHETECTTAPLAQSRPRPPPTPRSRARTFQSRDISPLHGAATQQRPLPAPQTPPQPAIGSLVTLLSASPASFHVDPGPASPSRPVPLDEAEDDNPHIIGPAIASDRHFLEDYLSSVHAGNGARIIRPVLPGITSAPIVFTRVQKRPLGVAIDSSPSYPKLQTIEKLLEPWQQQVVDMYFAKANSCFPVLDQSFFKDRSVMIRSRISPAVMACLYAHSLIYWRHDAELSSQRRPDGRFIWNLALEALYTELHLSPGMPSIIAILLNVGGRPTTTMIGNGLLLGCAISLAHCLGLNRNPIAWDIPEQEKNLRIQIWWCLVIHDRWSSLMYGTPPHIRQAHYDVPVPRIGHRTDGLENDPLAEERGKVFEALASLTQVLGSHLEQLYTIRNRPQDSRDKTVSVLDLSAWTDSLSGEVRRIIIRGTNLDVPGAANLRLCFLAAKFFSCRHELDAEMEGIGPGQPPDYRLLQARRIVEEIVLCVSELTEKQLGDFWLPLVAFAEIPASGPSGSLSLSLAKDLMATLRSHKEACGWELGDICLAQYGEVVDRLSTQENPTDLSEGWLDSALPFIPDPGFLDSTMADQWDPLLWGQMG
ncbi:fungal-specific transcription factor domain-containing protein [Fusarium solani]|uniref:Fungal-specific transcription factor domain-containing protein n=1 Tax=Fusarium solani TaxID=169388 RepID=A0A9P9KUJ9_FUSSL|nr:fungal-specific transcription factor domain-containing protein [Fusarium solani]KAH7268817.1 fungal-specific transcription factor domain-containing protein [Fusarium solani]